MENLEVKRAEMEAKRVARQAEMEAKRVARQAEMKLQRESKEAEMKAKMIANLESRLAELKK